jgi:hypothetical protein
MARLAWLALWLAVFLAAVALAWFLAHSVADAFEWLTRRRRG